MEKFDFSVLLPVYINDEAENFKAAVSSLLKQTLRPAQIVIVRDGPVELQIEEYLRSLEQDHAEIEIIRIQQNIGLGAALNSGLKKCKYEWVIRADSDDINIEFRLASIAKIISIKPDIDIISSEITEFQKSDKLETLFKSKNFPKRKVPQDDLSIKKLMDFKNPINHMAVAFKKNIILKSGGYKEMKYFEDYYLWLRARKNGANFYNIQESLVYARAGANMIARRSGLSYAKFELNFFAHCLKEKLISSKAIITWILLRTPSRLLPKNLIYFLYNFFMRQTQKSPTSTLLK